MPLKAKSGNALLPEIPAYIYECIANPNREHAKALQEGITATQILIGEKAEDMTRAIEHWPLNTDLDLKFASRHPNASEWSALFGRFSPTPAFIAFLNKNEENVVLHGLTEYHIEFLRHIKNWNLVLEHNNIPDEFFLTHLNKFDFTTVVPGLSLHNKVFNGDMGALKAYARTMDEYSEEPSWYCYNPRCKTKKEAIAWISKVAAVAPVPSELLYEYYCTGKYTGPILPEIFMDVYEDTATQDCIKEMKASKAFTLTVYKYLLKSPAKRCGDDDINLTNQRNGTDIAILAIRNKLFSLKQTETLFSQIKPCDIYEIWSALLETYPEVAPKWKTYIRTNDFTEFFGQTPINELNKFNFTARETLAVISARIYRFDELTPQQIDEIKAALPAKMSADNLSAKELHLALNLGIIEPSYADVMNSLKSESHFDQADLISSWMTWIRPKLSKTDWTALCLHMCKFHAREVPKKFVPKNKELVQMVHSINS